MITLEQILAGLPQLTDYELGEIRKQATVLMSLGSGGVKHPSNKGEPGSQGKTQKDSTDYTHEDFVLQAVCRVVRLSNGSPVQPQMLKRAQGTMATLREHLPDLMNYITMIDPDVRPGFMDMAIGLLVENIQKQSIPVTPVVVIRQLHRIPAVVDLAFPGYYHSNMLSEIFRRADAWPKGCHDPESCTRHKKCMYIKCHHHEARVFR